MAHGSDASDLTIVDIARARQQRKSRETAFTFLDNNLEATAALTYQSLDESARSIAAYLQRHGTAGDRVLLVFSTGPDFVKALFGCLYAGHIPLPIAPPQSGKPLQWRVLENVLRDAQARLILTDPARVAEIVAWTKQTDLSGAVQVMTLNDVTHDPQAWDMPPRDPQACAFMQYTSGSTNVPKGVVVTHQNLCTNAAIFQQAFRLDERTVTVSWLPHYHNMGLLGSMLYMFYAGARSYLMSPDVFLMKPVRWLEAVSRYRATVSGGPNFAYDLCSNVVSDAEVAALDLSAWEVACFGGDPVRHETLRAFTRKFAPCGFREEAFSPCYGLAEATMTITAVARGRAPAVRIFDRDALTENRVRLIDETALASAEERGRAKYFVSNGSVASGHEAVIVDPATSRRCADDAIGEVWFRGPSVTAGYWRKPAETEEAFTARLADEAGGPYLRTGDLGFISHGELYITGRLKDLIIIRGHNHYPQDIEFSVHASDPGCRGGGGAAFAVEHDDEERLVVVQEIPNGGNFESILDNARRAIVEQHEIQPYAVVLIKPGTLPRTPGGKVQRRRAKELYLAGQLDVTVQWMAQPAASDVTQASTLDSEVERQVAAIWAEVLKIPIDALGADSHFLQLGGDSLKAKMMLGRVADQYAVELPLAELFELPTVAHTARLIELCRNDASAPGKTEAVELEGGAL